MIKSDGTAYTPEEMITLEHVRAFVESCGGTVICASYDKPEIGDIRNVEWGPRAGFGNVRVELREYTIREATREEWLACPWPHRDTCQPDPLYYYEVGFD